MRGHLALLLAALLSAGGAAASEAAGGDAAQALHRSQRTLAEALRHNDFQQPLWLESQEREGELSGDVHALLPYPFAALRASLTQAAQWCELLMLQINIKHCEPAPGVLALHFGPRYALPLASTLRLNLDYQVPSDSPDYLRIEMKAANGPLGTRQYRILLEAVPTEDGQSFVHFSYAYGYGLPARLAMQTYLSLAGRGKIGFSRAPARAGAPPRPIDGLRAAIERNTMRHYLALGAYMDSLSAPAATRTGQRLAAWFDATERYALQLHEMERDDYLSMKRKELRLQP
ncbi:hypothetical protein [Roseateles toxinivorans]|uniref:Uncharacterized protein n=1 Tax=Roseateles toxinivorans TaxID=270368 RepID=A0A4V3CTA1_9BURK|nr:hypothetical protein [Roseateles toxinivorans]TDP71077.1 hypothetical protein DES47_10355 [Roseateles toxinivorans]